MVERVTPRTALSKELSANRRLREIVASQHPHGSREIILRNHAEHSDGETSLDDGATHEGSFCPSAEGGVGRATGGREYLGSISLSKSLRKVPFISGLIGSDMGHKVTSFVNGQ